MQLFCSSDKSPKPTGNAVLKHSSNGILSIEYANETRALCDVGFDEAAATTACHELYGTQKVEKFTVGRECGEKTFWLNGIHCRGTEGFIQDCEHPDFGSTEIYTPPEPEPETAEAAEGAAPAAFAQRRAHSLIKSRQEAAAAPSLNCTW